MLVIRDDIFDTKRISDVITISYRSEVENKYFSLTVKQLKQAIASVMVNCFAGDLASLINVKILSALPSTDANLNKPQMYINPITGVNIKFFQKHYGIEVEDEYGVYTKEIIDKLKLIKDNKSNEI